MWRVLLVALALLAAPLFVLLTAPAGAQEARTPVPHPPRGQGEHCVADTDFMRRNHMEMMMAHRREAVHEGARAPQFSLAGCMTCHVVNGDDGKPVSYASDQHFCRSCHAYAAVKIDCFECHKSIPEASAAKAESAGSDADAARLAVFLRESQK